VGFKKHSVCVTQSDVVWTEPRRSCISSCRKRIWCIDSRTPYCRRQDNNQTFVTTSQLVETTVNETTAPLFVWFSIALLKLSKTCSHRICFLIRKMNIRVQLNSCCIWVCLTSWRPAFDPPNCRMFFHDSVSLTQWCFITGIVSIAVMNPELYDVMINHLSFWKLYNCDELGVLNHVSAYSDDIVVCRAVIRRRPQDTRRLF
jgi:hypothetical protein